MTLQLASRFHPVKMRPCVYRSCLRIGTRGRGPRLEQRSLVTWLANDQWITTLAGRFGFAIDRGLFYAKAGGGWVGNNTFTVTNVTTGRIDHRNTNTAASGWLVGAGVEWALTNS